MLESQLNLYKTKDLGEAGALVEKNQQLLRVEREGSICWFVFGNKQECEALSSQYYFGKLLVEAKAYQDALKNLKTLIFNRY